MSQALSRWFVGLGGAVVTLALCGAASAQAPRNAADQYLEEIKRRQEVLAQKVEADVRAALDQALRLQTTDPARAAAILRGTLADVQNDTILSAARREGLKRTLADRIRVLESAPRPAAPAAGIRRVGEDANAGQQEAINRSLSAIRALHQQGRTAEANRMAQDLQRLYPENPAVIAMGRSAGVNAVVDAGRATIDDRDRRVAGALTGVDRAAMPPIGDVEFSKDWAKITANRKSGTKLSEKEKAILNTLNSTVVANFKETRLEDVIQWITDKTGQAIAVDKQALDDAAVGYDTLVSVQGRVTVRSLLHAIFKPYGLTYIVKDQTIQVISQQKAKETLVTRTYYLGDLVDTANTLGLLNLLYPGIDQVQLQQNANQLVDSIQSTVDPDSWKANGGLGTVYFHLPTRTLVVRQTAEVHALLGGSLP